MRRKKISLLLAGIALVAAVIIARAQGYFFARGSAAGTTLNTSLISYWKLDEASGTRVDSEPTDTAQDLTDNNTVTSNTGKISNAGQFTAANSEYLSRADSADLSTGNTDFSVAAWVYLDSTSNFRAIASKGEGIGSREWILDFSSSDNRFRFIVYDAGTTPTITYANTFGVPSTGTWYLVVGTCDLVNNLIGISVNAGTHDTAAFTGTPSDTASAFRIGSSVQGSNYMDGRIDEVGFWKKVLTSGERTELYAAGSGKTCCPFE